MRAHQRIAYNETTREWEYVDGYSWFGYSLGVFVLPLRSGLNEPGVWVARTYLDREGAYFFFEVGYTPDENGSAFVVIYV